MPLPEGAWVRTFSIDHPEVRLEVLNRLALEAGKTLTEIRLHGPVATDWAEEISGLPGVRTVEALGPAGSVTDLRVVHRASPFTPWFQELRLLRRFPFPIERGFATWTVVGPEDRVRRLLARLTAKAPGTTVESVRHDARRGPGRLTDRQREVFRRAMAAGYFEVPRRISLTELAHTLGLALSSLSEALAIIEKKLLEDQAGAE